MDFITCNSKKSKPKLNVGVCANCKRRRSCDDYSRYRQPLLFPELDLRRGAKRTKKRIPYPTPPPPNKKDEQLGIEVLLKPR